MLIERVRNKGRARNFWAVLGTFLVLGMGCSTWQARNNVDYGMLKVRPASGDLARIQRNASYYQLMGRPELALKELEDAHQVDPNNLQVANCLAEIYEKLGRTEQAQKIYLEVMSRDPDNQALQNNFCFSYYQAGNWQEAENCFRKTLAQHPGNTGARNNLGLVLCRQGRQEEARRLWQEAEGNEGADRKLEQALSFLAMTRPGPAPAAAAAPYPATPTPGAQAAGAARQSPRPEKPATTPGAASTVRPIAAVAARPSGTAPEPQTKPIESPQVAAPATSGKLAPARPPAPKAQSPVSPPASQTPAKPQRVAAQPAPARAPAPKPAVPKVAQKAPIPAAPARQSQPEQKGFKTAGGEIGKQKLRPLTCQELVETGIEVRNGNGVPDSARETRFRLSSEGYNVVDIGNHLDFGVDRTVIYYRPDAERVALELQAKFFQGAELASRQKLGEGVDVKILLGHDLSQHRADAGLQGTDKSL